MRTLETLPKLRESGFSLVCGHLAGEERLPMLNRDCVIVIGNEANGVSDGIARLLFALPPADARAGGEPERIRCGVNTDF